MYDAHLGLFGKHVVDFLLVLTDRQTEFSSLDRVCIACSAAKMNIKIIR